MIFVSQTRFKTQDCFHLKYRTVQTPVVSFSIPVEQINWAFMPFGSVCRTFARLIALLVMFPFKYALQSIFPITLTVASRSTLLVLPYKNKILVFLINHANEGIFWYIDVSLMNHENSYRLQLFHIPEQLLFCHSQYLCWIQGKRANDRIFRSQIQFFFL